MLHVSKQTNTSANRNSVISNSPPAELSILVTIAAYNVERTIFTLLHNLPYDKVTEVLVVDDGSQDHTEAVARQFPVTVIKHSFNKGVGSVIKTGLQLALSHNHDVFIIMAGNGKDNPVEIPR